MLWKLPPPSDLPISNETITILGYEVEEIPPAPLPPPPPPSLPPPLSIPPPPPSSLSALLFHLRKERAYKTRNNEYCIYITINYFLYVCMTYIVMMPIIIYGMVKAITHVYVKLSIATGHTGSPNVYAVSNNVAAKRSSGHREYKQEGAHSFLK
jgi:hypothetical protein